MSCSYCAMYQSLGQPCASCDNKPQVRPLCKVRGMPVPGGMCPDVIVGGKYCGYAGECGYKVEPEGEK